MKKIFFSLMFIVLLFNFIPKQTFAQSTTQKNIDALSDVQKNNEDLITGKELKEKTVSKVAEIYKIDSDEYAQRLSKIYKVSINKTDSFQLLHDNYGVEPSTAKDIAVSISSGKDFVLKDQKESKKYDLLSIFIILLAIYIISKILIKKKVIKIIDYKKFWNIVLFLSFLGSGLLGILLILKINFNLILPLPFNILFWHVDIGIVLLVAIIFHIIDHWYYVKVMFPKK